MKTKGSDRAGIIERRHRVGELTRMGLSAAQIAVQLRVSTRTVVRHRRALGIAEPPHHPFTDAEIRRATDLFDDGASLSEVARTIGRDKRTVRDHFPGRGWNLQQAGEHSALVRQMRKQGLI